MKKVILLTLLLVGFVASTASAQTVLWSDDFSGGQSAEWDNGGAVNGGVNHYVNDTEDRMEATGLGTWAGGTMTRDDRGLAIGETLLTELSLIYEEGTNHLKGNLIVANPAAPGIGYVGIGYDYKGGWLGSGGDGAFGYDTSMSKPDAIFISRTGADTYDVGYIPAGGGDPVIYNSHTNAAVGGAIGYQSWVSTNCWLGYDNLTIIETPLPTKPVITAQPEDVILEATGGTATFVVEATDPNGLLPGLRYNWYKEEGETDTLVATSDDDDGHNELTISPAELSDAGEYYCQVEVIETGYTADSDLALLAFVPELPPNVLWIDAFSLGFSDEWVGFGAVTFDVVSGEMVATGADAWGAGGIVRGDRGVAIGETIMTDLLSLSGSSGHAKALLSVFDDTTASNRVVMGWDKNSGGLCIFGEGGGEQSAWGSYPTKPDQLYLTRLGPTEWEGGVIYGGVATVHGTCTVSTDTIGGAIGYFGALSSGCEAKFDNLKIVASANPVIADQPDDVILPAAGLEATFTCVAVALDPNTGDPLTLGYTWYKEEGAVDTEVGTGDTLVLGSVQPANEGDYYCQVEITTPDLPCTGNTTDSDLASLTIDDTQVPTIDTQPVTQVLGAVGETATFTVAATNPYKGDSSGMTYLWHKDGSPMGGEESASLEILDAQLTDIGQYHCQVMITANSNTTDSDTVGLYIPQGKLLHMPMNGDPDDDIQAIAGVVTGTLTYPAGHDDLAVSIAIDSDQIDYDVALNTAQATFSAWVQPADTSVEWVQIVSKGSFWMGAGYAGTAASFFNGGGEATPVVFANGVWAHLVVTFDGTTARIYVDGTPADASYGATLPFSDDAAGNLKISVDAWNGLVDDVRVYGYALSDPEIQYLYTGVPACVTPPTYDVTGDCKVNLDDLAAIAGEWLVSGLQEFPDL